MKHLLIIFSLVFITGYLFTESWASEPEPINEMDALLKKIQSNTKAVGEATHQAHQVSEKLVESKVQEKKKLQDAVINAENIIQEIKQVQEIYAAKMISVGLDTSIVEISYKGQIYDAFLNYVQEGGQEDFEYFRLYLWQPK